MQSNAFDFERGESSAAEAQDWGDTRVFLYGNGPEIRLAPGKTAVIPECDGRSALNIHLDYLTSPSEMARATLQIIEATLSAYSCFHAQKVNNVIRRAFLDGFLSFDRPVGLKDITAWADSSKPGNWSKLKFYLTRLAAVSSKNFVSREVKKLLKHPEGFAKKRECSGIPLTVNDPRRGALTEQEIGNICSNLNSGYGNGSLTMFEYAFAWFLISTGVRPIQLSRMKVGDVLISPAQDGRRDVVLRIPLVKRVRCSGLDYSPRPAPRILADILTRYVASSYAGDADSPLFVSTSRKVLDTLERVFQKIDTFSERTGGAIDIKPYRFRYTIATRAIARGASDAEVAWLLTHRDTRSIKFYRAALPSLQEPLETVLGAEMNFLAGHFQGRIIESAEEAAEWGGNIIRDFGSMDGSILGVCGSGSECGLNAPRACLGCWNFRPLIDAPWDLMESVLLQEEANQADFVTNEVVAGQLGAVRAILAARESKEARESEAVK